MRIVEPSFYQNLEKDELKELIRQQLKELKAHMIALASAQERLLDLPRDKREVLRGKIREESVNITLYTENIEEMRRYLKSKREQVHGS